MPSSTTREIPREVKEMPAEAKRVWTAAFKRALKEKPEDMAGHLAMAAVKKLFSRVENEEGEEEWMSKEKAQEEREGEMAEAVRVAKGGDPDDPEDIPEDDPEDDPEIAEKRAERKGKRAVAKDPEFEKASNVIKAARAVSLAAGEGATADSDVTLTETLMLDAKGFRLTEDGFLVAEPRVARIGIQLYKGWEVGRPDMEDVRVYRPDSEVFDKKAMSSLAYRTITLEHPDAKVDATNWKELAIGHSGGTVARDGDFVRVPLVLMDAHAIQAAQSGTSQLSVGYGAKLQWGAGQAPDGQLYDAKQTEIRANHIALVSAARGGDKLKIGDANKGKQNGQQRSKPMTERTLTIDGVSITLEDKDSQILERHLAALTRRLHDQDEEIVELEKKTGEIESELEEAKNDAATKDGTIAALTQKVEDSKLSPDKLDKALSLRMDVVDRATNFFGDAAKYVWTGKTEAQIRRDVVTARMGEQKTKEMNDSMVEGAFLSITEPEVQDGFQRLTQSFSRPPVNNGSYSDAAAKAYDKRNEELANRFKKNRRPFGAAS